MFFWAFLETLCFLGFLEILFFFYFFLQIICFSLIFNILENFNFRFLGNSVNFFHDFCLVFMENFCKFDFFVIFLNFLDLFLFWEKIILFDINNRIYFSLKISKKKIFFWKKLVLTLKIVLGLIELQIMMLYLTEGNIDYPKNKIRAAGDQLRNQINHFFEKTINFPLKIFFWKLLLFLTIFWPIFFSGFTFSSFLYFSPF